MSLQEQTTYTKDTRANILNSTPGVSGRLAFATDSESLFIGVNETEWQEHDSIQTIGEEYVLPDYKNTKLSNAPLLHFDAANSNTIKNTSGDVARDGDSISEWSQTTQGKEHIRPFVQPSKINTPQYVQSYGPANKPGIKCQYEQGMIQDERYMPTLKPPFTYFIVYQPIRSEWTERAWDWGDGPATFQGVLSGDFGSGFEAKHVTIINKTHKGTTDAANITTKSYGPNNTEPIGTHFNSGHTILETGTTTPTLSTAILSSNTGITQTVTTDQGHGPNARNNAPSKGVATTGHAYYSILGCVGSNIHDYDNMGIFWEDHTSHYLRLNHNYTIGQIQTTSWPRDASLQNKYRYMTNNSPLGVVHNYNENFLGKPQISLMRVSNDDNNQSTVLNGLGTFNFAATGAPTYAETTPRTYTSMSASGFSLGARGTNTTPLVTYQSQQVYHEFMYFPALLTDDEINSVGEWLADKWGCEFWGGFER